MSYIAKINLFFHIDDISKKNALVLFRFIQPINSTLTIFYPIAHLIPQSLHA